MIVILLQHLKLALVNSAPEVLNTLDELAQALGNDPNFATTIANQIGGKVDKVAGKGLSTNDYTTSEKDKLAGIAEGAQANVNADWDATTGAAQILNKPALGAIASKNSIDKSDLTEAVQASLNKADSALQNYIETDPTVPDWAKADTKPTYTYDEVGADQSGSAANALVEAKNYTDEKIAAIPTPDVSAQIAVSLVLWPAI